MTTSVASFCKVGLSDRSIEVSLCEGCVHDKLLLPEKNIPYALAPSSSCIHSIHITRLHCARTSGHFNSGSAITLLHMSTIHSSSPWGNSITLVVRIQMLRLPRFCEPVGCFKAIFCIFSLHDVIGTRRPGILSVVVRKAIIARRRVSACGSGSSLCRRRSRLCIEEISFWKTAPLHRVCLRTFSFIEIVRYCRSR